jgi:hypothetical protein
MQCRTITTHQYSTQQQESQRTHKAPISSRTHCTSHNRSQICSRFLRRINNIRHIDHLRPTRSHRRLSATIVEQETLGGLMLVADTHAFCNFSATIHALLERGIGSRANRGWVRAARCDALGVAMNLKECAIGRDICFTVVLVTNRDA